MYQRPLLTVFFSLFMLAGCSEQPQPQQITATVIAFQPTSASQQVVRTLSGVLQPVDQSTLSFEQPGVVQKINVNLGETFAAGDVLASIDNKVFQLAVQQRQGQLSEAQARLTEAKLDFERKQQLVGSGAVSQAVVDVAESRYQSLVDQVNIAKTQLAIAQEDLDDTVIRAPFAGSVAQRHVEPSQQVSPSMAILTIQGSDALEVSVLVPESMIARVNKGDTVDVDIAVKQQRQGFTGHVFEKGKQAQRANAFPVTIALNADSLPSELQPGMSAEVHFSLGNKTLPSNSFTAPLSAIAAGANDTHFVFAIDGSGPSSVLRRVPITVYDMSDANVIFTSEQPVDRIVRVGTDFLSDGQTVHVSDDYPRTINQ